MDALDDIDYLSRSENRVEVLRTLVDSSQSRDELREATGIPRQTVARILTELESRGWVETSGSQCRATPLGTYVLQEFEAFHDRLVAAREVSDALPYLPDDAAALGVDAFLGSEVVRSTPGDPLSPVRRAIAGLRSVDDVRLLAGAVTVETLTASLTAVEEGQRFEAVFGPRVVESLRADEEMRSLVTDLEAHDGVSLYAGATEVDYSVGVGGGRVEFGLVDDRGAPAVYLATDDERVVAWATERINEAVAAADPLGLD